MSFILCNLTSNYKKPVSSVYIIYMQFNSKILYCLNSKYTFKQRDWTKGKAYINPFPHKMDRVIINIICLLCSFFSKRWLVYAARTNTDVCARNYLYPVFLLTKTHPRGFYQWIFIKNTPLSDWQDDQAQELGHAVYWVHLNQ